MSRGIFVGFSRHLGYSVFCIFFESMLNERESEGNRLDIELDDRRDEVRVEVKLQIV